ncbi:MAG: hypothetical protein E3J86_10155 [Candidatus Thorarchaeota archaeon]|nr:MAG: hypothetical protein E3J86_10155 [Candidatus Thorarchaeota archaeon]
MLTKPRVAVFCGFGDESDLRPKDKGVSEKDLAYRILCVCDHGHLGYGEKGKGIGNKKLNPGTKPLLGFDNYDFYVLNQWKSAPIAQEDLKLIEECDCVLAIFPERDDPSVKFKSSLYTLAEACAAYGAGKPVFVVAEDPPGTA